MSFNVTKTKKYYKVGELVFVKPIKKVGKVEELTIKPKTDDFEGVYQAKVTCRGVTQTFNLWDLDKLKDKESSHKQDNTSTVPTLKVKYADADIVRIEKFKNGDWLDLRAAETVTLHKDEYKLISLGVAIELPKGYEARIAPRSSTFKNFGIIQVNSVGVIDESFNGDGDFWKLPVYALRDTTIQKNDRICQFRIVRKMSEVNLVEVDKLGNEDRKGFGSTGTK